MNDLVIELILIAMIVVPGIVDSLQPARPIPRNSANALRKLRPGV